MDIPLPPASIWERYPEVSIIILVALVFVVLFVIYTERREKSWQNFLDAQRVKSEAAQEKQINTLKQTRDDDRVATRELIAEIKALREDHQEHDVRMLQAISKMEERTRPARKRTSP